MRPQTSYTARRGDFRNASWGRNRNTVRHAGQALGSVSTSLIMGLMVLIVGLIYITSTTKASAYDYELSKIDSEINDLEAKREDLAVEKARLTSIASSKNSEVAMEMQDATASGYAD